MLIVVALVCWFVVGEWIGERVVLIGERRDKPTNQTHTSAHTQIIINTKIAS